MRRKTGDADNESTEAPGLPSDISRASPGLRAAVDRMWRAMQRRREAAETMDPALFGQLDAADPAAIVERVARIEATLQALIESREYVLRAGPLEIDLISRSARRGERPIELLPREFRLLEYMMRRSNQLLTRATLLADVWNYKFVPRTNLVDVHMGRLRHKVDGPNETPMIHCVRGAGFILRAPT